MTSGRSQVHVLLQGAFATCVARLREQAIAVRETDDPEAVHVLRVALRRLRSDLRTMQPLLRRRPTRRLRALLRRLDAMVQPVRESWVALDALDAAMAPVQLTEDVVALLRAPLLQQRDASLTALREYLAGDDFAAAVEQLQRVDVTRLLRRRLRWRRTLRRSEAAARARLVRAARRHGARATDAQLHEVRILAKRARYIAEACVPVLGDAHAQRAAMAERVQTLLGEHQDTVMLLQHVQAVRSQPVDTDTQLQPLVDVLTDRRARLRAEWRLLRREVGASTG